MKQKLSLALVTIVFLSAMASLAMAAKLTRVKGVVQVQKKGKGKWIKGENGMTLSAGDRIRTKRGGTCVIVFGSVASVKLKPFSNLSITQAIVSKNSANIKTNQIIGKTFHKIKKALKAGSSYQVHTPTAIAGVKSTAFSVEVLPGGETVIAAFEAEKPIEFTAQGVTKHVEEGTKSRVIPGQPPSEPEPITEEEKEDAKQDEEDTGRAPTEEEIESAKAEEKTEPEAVTLTVDIPGETSQDTVAVKGITEPNSQVSVNDVSTSSDEAGNFSATISLKEGENSVTVTVTTQDGRTASLTRSIIRTIAEEDNIPPAIVVTKPPAGSVLNTPNVTISCKTEPDAKVSINGIKATVEADGTCHANVTLIEGTNVLNLKAEDAAGNLTTISHVLTLDTVPPFLTVQIPKDRFRTCNPVLQAIGVTEAKAKLRIQGQNVKVDAGGGFQFPLALRPGSNQIKFEAKDPAGNLARLVLSGTYEAMTSFLNVTQPQNNERARGDQIKVIGFTNPGSIVRVNQRSVYVDPGGKFEAFVKLNRDQRTRIVIESETKCGDQLKVVRTVLPDIPPPPPSQ